MENTSAQFAGEDAKSDRCMACADSERLENVGGFLPNL